MDAGQDRARQVGIFEAGFDELMPTGPLLIAIGDLHGHLTALRRLLRRLHRTHGVLEGEGLRAGVELVVTGDFIDRGDDALGVIALLRGLERAGPGRVVGLLGNHEIMALEGVEAARALLAGGVPDPIVQYELTSPHGHNGGDAFVREFGSTPRAAMAAFVRRMGPRGDVGGWLRALRAAYVARVGGQRVLLAHGDLARLLRSRQNLARYLAAVTRLRAAGRAGPSPWRHPLLASDEALFWNRSFGALDPSDVGAAEAICEAAEVDYIVTGHTPHERIACYGGRIFGIDVGMTPFYGENEPVALVFDGRGVVAVGAERGLVPLSLPQAATGVAA